MSLLLHFVPIFLSKYSLMHFVYSFALLCYFGNSFFLFKKNSTSRRYEQDELKASHEGKRLLNCIARTMFKFDFLLLLIAVLVVGMAFQVKVVYQMVVVKELDPNVIFPGIILFAGELCNMLFLQFSAKLLTYCGGPNYMLIIIFMGVAARFCIIGFSNSVYLILAAQVFHAMDYQLICITIVNRVKESSPHIVSSLIGIYMATFSIGKVAGSILGGMAFEKYGGGNMFIGAGIISFVSALTVCTLIYLRTKFQKKAIPS